MRILITAGGTRQYIDPVRFISNASSGKMGYALANAALKAGHKVTLITAPTNLKSPKAAKVINIETAGDMFGAVRKNFPRCDCLLMAAAVADYTPAGISRTKIKKDNTALTVKLKPAPDILKWAGRNKRAKQLVVGFALEDRSLKANAERKLVEKNLDMIIANSPAAIGAEKATVYIKSPKSAWLKITAAKDKIASRIISLAEAL